MTTESRLNTDFKDILDHFPAGCQIIDFDWQYRYVNAIGAQHARQAPAKLIGQKITDVYPGLAETPAFQTLTQCMTGRTSATLTHEFVYPDNTTAWFELHVRPIPDGLLVMSLEMTERQRSEVALKKSTRALKLLGECNQVLVRVDDEQRLLAEICRLIVETGGHRMAWVGLAEHDQAKSVRPIAQVGFEDGYLDRAQITWADNERGRGPTGTAIRTGVVQVNQNVLTNPAMTPWREAALARGYQSSIALPLKDTSSIFGALNIYSAEPDAFDAEETRLLTELANDLAYGLIALRTRTAHLRAEEGLLESEEKYRRLFSEMLAGSALHEIICDDAENAVDYVTLEVNRAFESLLGATRDMVINRRASEVLPAEELKHWLGIFGPVALTGQSVRYEMYSPINQKHFEGNAYCPKPGQFAVTFSDVTARKRAEDALYESEERFRSLYENSTVGLYRTTPAGHILMANPALIEILGYTSFDDLTTRNLQHTGFEPTYGRTQFIKAVERAGEVKGLESAWTRQDGTVIFIRESARAIRDANGQTLYYDGIVEDITARKRAEEALRESEKRYRRIAEGLTDYQYSVRVEHGRPVETTQSPTCLTVTGYTAEEFAADPYLWIRMIAPEDRELVLERVQQILAGMEIPPIEHRIYRRDGEIRWVSDTIILFKDAAGNLLSYDGVIKDITDRKRTEAALRASEERFRALVENSADIIALLASDGRILYESPAVKRVLGYQPDEMVGHNGFEFLHPGDYTLSQELFGRLLQPHHTPVTTELRYKRKDGTWAWVQATGTNLLANPSVQALVINYQDITERKRATETLREVNETLQALFDYSPLAITMLDLNGYVRLWNKAAERMYGWTASEVVGQFLPAIPAGKVEEYQALHQRVIQGESITYTEVERQRRDGSSIFVGLSVAPLRDAAGRIYAQMSIAVDITERKQRERELEVIALMATALRAAPSRGDMLPVIVDQTLAILQGKGAALVMNRSAADEAIVVLARGDWAAQTGQHTRRQHSLAGRVILTGQATVIRDVRAELPVAEVAAFQGVTAVAGVPLTEQVETIGALLIGRTTPITSGELRVLQAIADIAANALHRASIVETLEQRVVDRTQDLVAVNAQLAAANERLQELDRLKSKFVSDVSHELRTPITALNLNVDLLERARPGKREQYLQAIRQQVKRQAQLLEDILNLSRLELGADKVRFAPVALNALIAQIVAVHQPAADAKNLTLTFMPYHELPVVPGEENQLAQVITNLIGNAINYTAKGKIEASTSANEREVVIEVRDTGLGIDPEDLPHLFERFYRGSRTRDIRGTGLGLAIVKEIVNLHDGRVEVESQIDVGTTFRVYLPLTASSPSARKTNEAPT